MFWSSWSTMYQSLHRFCVWSVLVMYMTDFGFRINFRSVHESVFLCHSCVCICFSTHVSDRFSSVSVMLRYVWFSADMTLLVLLISPLLSNFWLSRIFLFVFVFLFYRYSGIIWDFSEERRKLLTKISYFSNVIKCN
ncbi:hypothetical protein Hdeb2414_s0070g00772431 [Helianthus debilis subsp. tardiflorus]